MSISDNTTQYPDRTQLELQRTRPSPIQHLRPDTSPVEPPTQRLPADYNLVKISRFRTLSDRSRRVSGGLSKAIR